MEEHPMPDDDLHWQAVLARDAASDAAFVYSVASTGVYCRPTCPSRRPLRRNVRFFMSCDAAEAAGFRACKRCDPRGVSRAAIDAERIAAAAHALSSDNPPGLAELARRAGLSPFHFHRMFRKATGVTPKVYAEAQREARARQALAGSAKVTDAIYDAGYAAPRRFYERAEAMLGMSPSAFRRGGERTAIAYIVEPTSLGEMLVAHTAKGVCAILIGDAAEPLLEDLRRRFPRAAIAPADENAAATLRDVITALDRPQPGPLPLPLDLQGTLFQQKVWRALQAVPPGSTVSYADLAARLGAPKAMRAVAGACAANPTAIAVPCHRVVRADGTLSGYRWGTERKAALLKREGGR
jgi:AraC family transcriptional regulator of adaptative response/methylated-DNA-[protein]-cysteine methyltransferase